MSDKKNINDYDMNKYISKLCNKLTDVYKDFNSKFELSKKIDDVTNSVDNKINNFTNKAVEHYNNQWARTADHMLTELHRRATTCVTVEDKELICDKIDVIMLLLEKEKRDLEQTIK